MSPEATIEFIPTRLNAAPVVFRGMTGREVVLVTIAGLTGGLGPGLASAWALGQIAMVPTVMFAAAGATVWYGGGILRRVRRGRPETWLYRRIQWMAARVGFNSAGLIMRSATYRIGRDRRLRGLRS